MKDQYLVTGGAGFIGSNYVNRLIKRGEAVTIYDNLSRSGSVRNLEWLKKENGAGSFELVVEDIRNIDALKKAAVNKTVIVHLAAQVAVTTSVINPRDDFEVNALGTFNSLEAARSLKKVPLFIYASTNKVYGGMEEIELQETATRYEYRSLKRGISESFPINFHSPYGCSKGCGDQYVRDYQRIYSLPSYVFRQSCIYGPRQFGIEDQGWVAWFVIAAITNRKIKIYGDGKQVRDLLFIDDLLDAYDAAVADGGKHAGEIFNLGGGVSKSLSVYHEFFPVIEKLLGKKMPVEWGGWRPGDQKVYISDIRKAKDMLGWSPKIGVEEGIKKLFDWVQENNYLFYK